MAEKSITEQRKKCTEALELLGSCSATNPELLISIVDCYFTLGKYVTALEMLEKGIKRGWKLPEIVEYKGKCLFKLGEFERAIYVFKEAIEIGANARECDTWLMRCKAHAKMEQWSSNMEYHRDKVIVIDPPITITELKHDWYQSKTDVTLVVYCAGLTEDQVKVKFGERSVDLFIEGKERVHVHYDLEKEIKDGGRVSVGKSKIEVKMAKAVPNQNWKL